MANRDCWTTLHIDGIGRARALEVDGYLSENRDEFPYLFAAFDQTDWDGYFEYEYHEELRRISRKFPDALFRLHTHGEGDCEGLQHWAAVLEPYRRFAGGRFPPPRARSRAR